MVREPPDRTVSLTKLLPNTWYTVRAGLSNRDSSAASPGTVQSTQFRTAEAAPGPPTNLSLR